MIIIYLVICIGRILIKLSSLPLLGMFSEELDRNITLMIILIKKY